MIKPHIKLRVLAWEIGEPLCVLSHEFLDTLSKFLNVEKWHVKMIIRLIETLQMILHAECLRYFSLFILNNSDAFIARDAIVEG